MSWRIPKDFKAEIATRYGRTVAELVDEISNERQVPVLSGMCLTENFRKDADGHGARCARRADQTGRPSAQPANHGRRATGQASPDRPRDAGNLPAPIARAPGLNNIARQLQDISFQHIHPTRFQVLSRAIKAVRGNRRELLQCGFSKVSTATS